MKILVTKGFEGQIRPYADYVYEYFIESDCTEEEIVDFAKFVLNRKHLPDANEFFKNNKDGLDLGYYSRGYYSLHKCGDGWKFIIHEPYMD